MSRRSTNTVIPLIGLGILAGMRSVSPLAALSAALAQQPDESDPAIVQLFGSSTSAKAFALLAAGEMIADKLPFTPARTAVPVLLGRVLTGGSVGALLELSRERPAWVGALAGGALAVASTYAAYHLRMAFRSVLHIPQPFDGILEDDLVIFAALWLVHRLNDPSSPR